MKLSTSGRHGQRIAAAAMALAALLALGGCHKAAGLGIIGAPLDTGVGPIPDVPTLPIVNPNGKAHFAFTYYCDPKDVRGRVYTYKDTSTNGLHRGLELQGKVTNTLIDTNGDGFNEPATSCQDLVDAPAAQFEGTYMSTDRKYHNVKGGRFTILVFDQNNPDLPAPDTEFTGDGFSIELFGGPYNLYTRAGYIEKGEIYAE